MQVFDESAIIRNIPPIDTSKNRNEEKEALQHSPNNINFDTFKTTSYIKGNDVMNDKTNMYLTASKNEPRQHNRIKIDNQPNRDISDVQNPVISDNNEDNLWYSSIVNQNSDINLNDEQEKTVHLNNSIEDESKSGKILLNK